MHKTKHCLICFLQLALCLLHNKAPLYDKPYDIKDNVNEGNNISVIIFNPTKLLRRYFQEPPPKDFLMLVVVAVLPHQKFLIFTNCFLTFLDFSLYCKNYNLGGCFLPQACFTLYSFILFCCICDSDESSSTQSRILLALIDLLLLIDTWSWTMVF